MNVSCINNVYIYLAMNKYVNLHNIKFKVDILERNNNINIYLYFRFFEITYNSKFQIQ